VAKLALLEEEFQDITSSTDEMTRLWKDVDTNGIVEAFSQSGAVFTSMLCCDKLMPFCGLPRAGNGDISMTEWNTYVAQKFNAISNQKSNIRAFKEAATASSNSEVKDLTGHNWL